MGLPTCKFVQKPQNPTARDAQPVDNSILLLFLPLRLGCAPFGKNGFRSRIVSAFESLQYMKVSFIYGAMLVIMDKRGNSVWIAKRVERKRGIYA